MHSPFNDLCQRSILPWIIRGGSDVRHARDANELLEVASDELRAIVGDNSRLGFQVLLLGSLQDHFDLLRAATNPRDRALVELFYATGCRVGEMAVIRVEHIDFTRRRIPVRAKRKERVVYFGLPASRALRKYLGGRRSGYLFQDIIPQQKGHITYY